MNQDYQSFRRDYHGQSLHRSQLDANPIVQFGHWLDEATKAYPDDATSMTLATTGANGLPTARMVLLKWFDDNGFVWFTDSGSEKGKNLEENPHACLLFYWHVLERQVRICGQVEVIDTASSDAYFARRPRVSQISALAAQQSQIIASRTVLEQRVADVQAQYDGISIIPRPPTWQGYRLIPDNIEFWQGRISRLHDRLRYRHNGHDWLIERLAP